MKRLILFLFLILPCFVWANPYILDYQKASTSSYSDITYYHDCNALDDANKSGGSASVTYTSPWSIDSTNPQVGTGAWQTTATGYNTITIPMSNNINLTTGGFGVYLRFDDNTDPGPLIDTNVEHDFQVKFFDAGVLSIYYMDGSYGSVALDDYTTGTWHFFEFYFSGGTVTVYQDDSLLGTASGTTAITATNITFSNSTGASTAYSVDQFIVTNLGSRSSRNLYNVRNITDFD